MSLTVTKRDGTREPLDMEKSNKVLIWACQGIEGVSPSEVAMRAAPRIYDGIPTTDIHKSFIDAAEEMIHDDYHYAEVMSRLLVIDLWKRVYGDWNTIKPLQEVVAENSARGLYDPQLAGLYTDSEWATLNSWIDHHRDYSLKGAGVKQFIDKYLVQDRSTKRAFETPQVAYMLCAAAGLAHLPRDLRMEAVRSQYHMFSEGKISLPTPVLAGVRQKNRQYASCILIDVGDDLDSITDCAKAATLYASKRAGLGINVGRIRPAGSKIGSGEVVSTGLIPFLRKFESAIKSCSQGGIRDASATAYLPVWHPEIQEVLALKSAKTEEAKAVRRLDYAIQWDSYLLRRAVKKQPITLFSPHEVPDLYEAFFAKDRRVFEALYEKYEADTSLMFRKTVDARTLYEAFLVEASETARYYDFKADHVNTHTPFLDPVYMSNLCVEVALPTEPMRNTVTDVNPVTMTGTITFEGLVQLCILAAINMGDIDLDNHKDMEGRMRATVFYLNELIDHMDFVVPQSARATREYRPLGIGMVNYAYFLAQRGLRYGEQKALDLTHRLMEQMYYYALKASCEYARISGKRVPAWDRLIYSQGRTLLDTYCRRVDELTTQPLECDWPTLLADIKKWGLANSTLLAMMPSESSSVVLNATNGVEPIRALVTTKGNKKKKFTQAAPEPVKHARDYHMLWDMTAQDFEGYIKSMAVIQKWTCQSISTNFSYNPNHYPGNKVPLVVLMNHTQLATKYGVKTRYYINTKGEGEDKVQELMSELTKEEKEAGFYIATSPVIAMSPVDEQADDSSGCAGGACKI